MIPTELREGADHAKFVEQPKSPQARARDAGWPNGRPGNRRKGQARGRRPRRGVKARNLPWRQDPVILERVSVTAGLMVRGYRQAVEMLPELDDWAQAKREPPPTIATIRDDMRRARILAAESAEEESLNVVYSMAAVEREAWQRATDDTLPHESRVKREYLDLAGRMVVARSHHEHQGIEAALEQRGMVLAEKYAEIMLTVVVDVVSSAPIERSAQMWIRNKIADELQAKVIDARPAARLES